MVPVVPLTIEVSLYRTACCGPSSAPYNRGFTVQDSLLWSQWCPYYRGFTIQDSSLWSQWCPYYRGFTVIHVIEKNIDNLTVCEQQESRMPTYSSCKKGRATDYIWPTCEHPCTTVCNDYCLRPTSQNIKMAELWSSRLLRQVQLNTQ